MLDKLLKRYIDEIAKPMITKKARDLVSKHRAKGDKLLIITATNSYITKPIGKLFDIDDTEQIDIAIDGADEVSPDMSLIKGLGGALLREKKVEKKAKELIIIVDEGKLVQKLGRGDLPVEVRSKDYETIGSKIEELGCEARLRIEENDEIFITGIGNNIRENCWEFKKTYNTFSNNC